MQVLTQHELEAVSGGGRSWKYYAGAVAATAVLSSPGFYIWGPLTASPAY